MYTLDTPRVYTATEVGWKLGEEYTRRTGTPVTRISFPHRSGDETQMVFWDGDVLRGRDLYHIQFPAGATYDEPRTRFEVVSNQADETQLRESVEALRQELAGK